MALKPAGKCSGANEPSQCGTDRRCSGRPARPVRDHPREQHRRRGRANAATRSTGVCVRIVAPASTARRASSLVTRPMPPSTTIHVPSDPGRRHMLWTRKFIPVPRMPNERVEAREAVGDGVHRHDQIALKSETGEVFLDRLASTRSRNAGAMPAGCSAPPFLQPRAARAASSERDRRGSPRSRGQRLRGRPVLFGEELSHWRRVDSQRRIQTGGIVGRWSGGSNGDPVE